MSRSVFPNPERGGFASISTKKMPPPVLQVQPGARAGVAADAQTPPSEREFQGYLERVRNYIPAEIVAFFIFVNSLVGNQVRDAQGTLDVDGYVAAAALVASIVGCVLFVRATAKAENNPVWRLQAVVSVVALLIWAYAMNAKIFGVFDVPVVPSVSGFMVACFTLLSGFIVPSMPKDAGGT